jgi:hypothetical protein
MVVYKPLHKLPSPFSAIRVLKYDLQFKYVADNDNEKSNPDKI